MGFRISFSYLIEELGNAIHLQNFVIMGSFIQIYSRAENYIDLMEGLGYLIHFENSITVILGKG